MSTQIKISVGAWYILPNTLRPEDRSLDYRVLVTDMDQKTVHFETEPAPGWARGTPLSLPRAAFRKLASPVKE
ncbi:hypothetical protein [Acidithiobacillus ferrooxidans]|uniref:Uncharacterized protein n=1 Tax=Acidithiobacillus ferrooxidans TaxID=920 RepID=A0A2W1K7L4_ACIFR|nr:hypothetical protein [Acidithiobacillus ferrooxidans]MBU2816380.1 hypothetical protein [Acidithiobacillus ferrooxidans]MCR1344044.1 hypothetical protein [Acidithiobacillus ferrooxidans]PZD82420.1 hypothetical protein DN052_05225 [Acidithiobacillus ferrooxidans]QLK41306.1 hypothetical protein FE661_03340 [Acidithiobacillus ferrooxidans]QZT53248.1 hypothetical protein K7B00_03340 [Acidithiobacillus ferrooxidans]